MCFIPEKKTCETCDWWCYGTYPDNTCDKWEFTIFSSEIPLDMIEKVMPVPTLDDLDKLRKELDDISSERN